MCRGLISFVEHLNKKTPLHPKPVYITGEKTESQQRSRFSIMTAMQRTSSHLQTI